MRRLTTNPHKCTFEILQQWRSGGENRKNLIQMFFASGCDVTKTTVSLIMKDIMVEPISQFFNVNVLCQIFKAPNKSFVYSIEQRQEKKKKEALTEEQVYAFYAPNEEKAKMAIHFAVQEGRRYLSIAE